MANLIRQKAIRDRRWHMLTFAHRWGSKPNWQAVTYWRGKSWAWFRYNYHGAYCFCSVLKPRYRPDRIGD